MVGGVRCPGRIFGLKPRFAFGLFLGLNRFAMTIKNKASALNGRLGGRPKSLILLVSSSGGFSWSLAGDVVEPVLLVTLSADGGGVAMVGGRRYSSDRLAGFPVPGVYKLPARGAAPVNVVPASVGSGWEYDQIDPRNGKPIGRGGRPPGVEVFYKDRSQTQYFNDEEKALYLAEWDRIQARMIRAAEIEAAMCDIESLKFKIK